MSAEEQNQLNTPERQALAEMLRNSRFLQEHLDATSEKDGALSPLETVAQGLAQRATFEVYPPEKDILLQNTPVTGFFFIITGQVRITRTNNKVAEILNYMGEGEFLGELGLLTRKNRYATATTILETFVARFETSAWDWLLETAPVVKKAFEDIKAEYEEHQEIKDFSGRQPDEVLLKNINRHIMVWIASLSIPLLLILIALVLEGLIQGSDTSYGKTITQYMIGFSVIFGFIWAVYAYFEWDNDDFIISTKRVIHIERYVFSGIHREEAPLTRVLDIEVNTPNFLTRTFGYSNVIIKTAGLGTITFDGINNGERIKELIFNETAKAKARMRADDIAAIRKSLRDMHAPPTLPVLSTPKVDDKKSFTLPSFSESLALILRFFKYYIPRSRQEIDGKAIIWRKHWWVWLKKVWFVGIMLIVTSFFLGYTLFHDHGAFIGISLVAWVIAFLAYTYQHDDWHKDTYKVTDTKIIHQDSTAFRLRGEEIKETTFDNVQSIDFSTPSFIQRIFSFGDVTIRTAAVGEPFVFNDVHYPKYVQQDIFKYWEAFKKARHDKEQAHEEERYTTWLREYDKLRK